MTAINPRGRLRCDCCSHKHAAEIDVGLSRGMALGQLILNQCCAAGHSK
jgi:hypothetical protein